uniref:PH domain-containing protein n=1 Tax=Heterorhabditis bacteriophora TaxID=37862 RepID=A0A1I7XAP0_HETBA
MASSIFLETEVIHYSPPGTIRRATHSPDHVTDFPNIERRSNVILKDPNRLKSIPVTRYDGRSKQETIIQPLEEKKQTISPSSVIEKSTSIDVASVSIDQCSYSAPLSSKTTPYSPNKGIIRKIEASSSKSLQRTNMQQNPGFISNSSQSVSTKKDLEVTKYEIEDAQRATEITNRYKALKAKFDIWQTLQTTGKNLPETKELHVELIRDHDSLMRQLQLANTKESSPTRVGIGKKRQSITPDLFTPKSLLGIRTISNSSPALPHRPSLSLKDIRYPTSTGSSSSHTSSPSSSRFVIVCFILAKSQIKVQSHHSTINEISRLDLINSTNTLIKGKIKEKGNNKIRRPENMPSLKKVENYENRNNQSPEATTMLIPQMPHYEICHHKLVASNNGKISPARTNQEAVISKYNYQKLPINQSKDELVKDVFSKPAICQNKASPQEIMPKLDKSIVLKQERTLIDDAPTVSNHYKMTPSKENNNIAEEKGANKPPSSITKAKKCKKLTEVECTKIHLNTEYSTRNKTNIEQITPPNTKKAVKEKEGIINNITGEGFSTLKKVPTPVEKSGIQLGKVIDSPTNIKISILPTISSPSSHSSIPIPPPPPPPMELLSNLSRSSAYVVSTATTPTLSPKISVSLEQLNEQKLKLKPASMARVIFYNYL